MPTSDATVAGGSVRERRRRVLTLALPIIGGMVSQNVMNLVDTGMVGVLGDHALAAVGLASFVNFLTGAFVMGLSSGVQAIAARRVGEGRDAETAVPLNGGILLAVLFAAPWSVALIALAPSFFPLLNDDPQVVEAAVPYLQVRLAAMTALGVNFAFRGYWNAIDMSMLYMRTLVVMHVTNIVLNWLLIFGHLGAPELGATGAGLASAIATFVGSAYYFVLGFQHARPAGFLRGLPDRAAIVTMLRLAVPMGIQQTFFAGGMVAFFALVGVIGTPELAATQVLMNLFLVGLLPGLGFGIACATLVGQALGRGEPDDAARWGWQVTRITVAVIALGVLPALALPEVVLGVFIHEPDTLALAVTPLRLLAIELPLDVVGMVLMQALIGAGATLRTMVVSLVMQWIVFLPGVYLFAVVLELGLIEVFLLQGGYRILQSAIFAALWRQGSWARVEV